MSAFGNILGIRALLQFGMGAVLLPAGLDVMEAIQSIEISITAEGGANFRLELAAGRSGPLGVIGPPFVNDPRFQVGGRIGVSMVLGVRPVPIFHGVVTRSQYLPANDSHDGRLLLLGRDLTALMDRFEYRAEWPALAPNLIATAVLAQYVTEGIVPAVMPPLIFEQPNPVDYNPQQCTTDLAYLRELARCCGYHVVIQPGPVPGTSTVYWGPMPIPGLPQKTLSVDLGPMSDAFNVTVNDNSDQITTATGQVTDRMTGVGLEIIVPAPPGAPQGALPIAVTRIGQLREERIATSGMSAVQALACAAGTLQQSAERAVQVTGTINNVQYNDVLKPFEQVNIRGLGARYNGLYTVSGVRHAIRPGDYSQTFTLQRGEFYSLVPVVPPELDIA
jgi:hypothetical protein